MARKVTIQQIADHVGLSKFAVSRALSGKTGVSEHTRETIMTAADQLGYFVDTLPNQSVNSSLIDVSMHSWGGTILVLFPNVRYQNSDSVYWGPVFEGISSSLNEKNINIVTLTEPNDDSVFSLLNSDAIRGVITVGFISTAILLDIKRLGIPVVMIDHLDHSFNSDAIFTDNFAGMRDIMNAMLHKGCRKFQFIGNIADAQSYYERWIAYSMSLQENHITQQQAPILLKHELNSFQADVVELYKNQELPEVFVCVNDFYAAFTIEAFEKAGIQIKENCLFTGFDHTDPKRSSIATINVDKRLIGKRAVDQMLWRILNPHSSFEKKLIQGTLILRD